MRKIAAYILLFLAVPAAYILAGLKDGFTLEAFDFGTSMWWNVGLMAFLLSSFLFAWAYNRQGKNENIYTQYTIVIEPDEDGFHAFCPALKGCHTCGNTQAEALEYIRDAIVGYVASLEKHGDPVPVAQSWQSATLKL